MFLLNFFLDTGIAPKNIVGPNPTAGEKEIIEIFEEEHMGTFVSKWVDYSTKYGLGYLLSNGTAGVVFNDSTRITLEGDGSKFEYMEKKHEEKREIISTYSLQNYPKELYKKVTLLKHFKGYLEGNEKSEGKVREFENGMIKNGLHCK